MERMQKEAEDIGDGVLGIVEVKLHETNHGWGSHVIEFFALGTAVVPNEHSEPGNSYRTSRRSSTSTTDPEKTSMGPPRGRGHPLAISAGSRGDAALTAALPDWRHAQSWSGRPSA